MKYTDKEFVALAVSMMLFMVAIGCQIVWGIPTDQQLGYASIAWMIAACVSGLYSWHLESKDEV